MPSTLKSRIEAVLFVAANPMSIKEIAQVLNQEEVDIEEALLNLMFDYQSSDGALEIDDENGYILQVKKEHLDIVEKLCPVELRGAVVKTLSVIALKEPIRLTYLKELRGTDSYNHVNELVEKGLITKTKDKNGRSFNLKTTPKFSEYFRLKGDTQTLAKILDIEKAKN